MLNVQRQRSDAFTVIFIAMDCAVVVVLDCVILKCQTFKLLSAWLQQPRWQHKPPQHTHACTEISSGSILSHLKWQFVSSPYFAMGNTRCSAPSSYCCKNHCTLFWVSECLMSIELSLNLNFNFLYRSCQSCFSSARNSSHPIVGKGFFMLIITVNINLFMSLQIVTWASIDNCKYSAMFREQAQFP